MFYIQVNLKGVQSYSCSKKDALDLTNVSQWQYTSMFSKRFLMYSHTCESEEKFALKMIVNPVVKATEKYSKMASE